MFCIILWLNIIIQLPKFDGILNSLIFDFHRKLIQINKNAFYLITYNNKEDKNLPMSWCWNPSCVSTTKGMLLTVKTVHFYVTESVLCLFPYMKLLRRKGLLFYTIIRIWDKNNIAAKFLLFSRTMLSQQRILKQKSTIQKESISGLQFYPPRIRMKKITSLVTPVNCPICKWF